MAANFRTLEWKEFVMVRSTLAVVLLLVAVSAAGAQEKPADEPGLKIGDPVPEVVLKDQNGESVELAVLLKKSPVAIVFYRSASW